MKHVLGFLGILLLGILLLNIASPAKGQAVVARIVHFVDPIPPTPAFEEPPHSPAPVAIGAALPPPPPWKVEERTGDRAYAAGDFLAAYVAFADAATKAPPAEAGRLHNRADRANVSRLLSLSVAVEPGPDPVADESEYRRRLDAVKPGAGAGAFLELADFAVARDLRSHLAYLYERAFEHKSDAAPGTTDEVQKKVTRLVKKMVAEKKAENAAPAKEMLESVIRELPTSEAADIARVETGAPPGGSGLGGVERRGETPVGRPEDAARVAEAFRQFKTGDAEYRLAVPGSRDVNKHRRAALDAFTKARTIFEEIDRAMASEAHSREVHDCNRNIAELRKDLPIGK